MSYEKDYIMRVIKEMVRVIAAIAFGKDAIHYDLPEDEKDYTERDLLYQKLFMLADQGKLNEAENLLFEQQEDNIENVFELGLNFYLYLNELSNEELEQYQFSREEIVLGIKDLAKLNQMELPDDFFEV